MTFLPAAIIAGCVLVGLGARLGPRRFSALAIAGGVGSLAAWGAGPGVAAFLAMLVGAESVLSEALGRVIAYLVSFAVAVVLLSRPIPRSAAPLSRRARRQGAVLALPVAAALGWIVLGELPADERGTSPSVAAEGSAALDVLRPVAVVRACRVLSSLDAAEAERLAARPEVEAVIDSPSLERLFRRPGLVRRMAAASDGDWRALALLAADPDLKTALDDPEFRRRVQAVDVVALATEIEAHRRGDAPRADRSPTPRLPAYALDPDVSRRVVAEWSGEALDSPLAEEPPTPAERQERYWRNVEVGLNLLGDGAGVLP